MTSAEEATSPPQSSSPHASSRRLSNFTNYLIKVKTSDRFGAGTDSNVRLQLTGESGVSNTFELKKSNFPNKFERNQLDEFKFLGAEEIGLLDSLKVWHDNTGALPAWHLEYIEVSDTGAGKMFRFPCHNWLGGSASCEAILRCMETTDGPRLMQQVALGVPNPNLPPTRKKSLQEQIKNAITYQVSTTN